MMIVPSIKHRHPITTNAESDSRIKEFSATTRAKTWKLANTMFGFLSLICKLTLPRRSTFQCITCRNC
jgi:hypothetical protein